MEMDIPWGWIAQQWVLRRGKKKGRRRRKYFLVLRAGLRVMRLRKYAEGKGFFSLLANGDTVIFVLRGPRIIYASNTAASFRICPRLAASSGLIYPSKVQVQRTIKYIADTWKMTLTLNAWESSKITALNNAKSVGQIDWLVNGRSRTEPSERVETLAASYIYL